VSRGYWWYTLGVITTLTGKVAEKLSEIVVVDIQGVGYGLYLTAEDYGHIKIGDDVKMYIYEHIRENAHDLFGFISPDTKGLFEQLLGVNGVGPKMALNMLSISSTKDLKNAIATGEVKYIQAASGVGKRVAERVVVDLKDKVGLISTSNDALFMSAESAQKDEAVQALVGLGYSVSDAVNALSQVDDKLSIENRVKQALKDKR